MLRKSSLLVLGLLAGSLNLIGAGSAPKVKEAPMKAEAPKPMSFEECCDEHYGDSDACHKLSHVTGKTKKDKGKMAPKECFEGDNDTLMPDE